MRKKSRVCLRVVISDGNASSHGNTNTMKVRIKHDLYFCMEDDGMTRDGETYSADEIRFMELEHVVICNEDGSWKVQIPKGTVCNVYVMAPPDCIGVEFNNAIEQVDKEQCEWIE